ncbi:MAG: SRPBCC family protein [Acidimicrobiales bacterium]
MELNNDFEVNAPIEKAWAVLTDVEKIAPCLPGAQLQEVEGDEYRGIVKVKVGPITAQYKGAATFVEKDDANHRAVLKADGRDTRGAGNASAMITAQLQPVGDRTKVSVSTDLTVTGKVAQFGRGVMADVSAKLMTQFADNLEKLMEGEPAAAAKSDDTATTSPATAAPTAPSSAPSGGVRKIDSPEATPVDIVATAGSPVLKRLAPVLGALLGLSLLLRRFRRRRNK